MKGRYLKRLPEEAIVKKELSVRQANMVEDREEQAREGYHALL